MHRCLYFQLQDLCDLVDLFINLAKEFVFISWLYWRFIPQGGNPLLVRLDYEVTKVSGRFSKVHLQYSEEFEKVMAANKKVLKIDALSEDDAVTEVKT